MKYKIDNKSAFLLIDIQNDFLPGGALAVPGGDEILPIVNALMLRFENIFKTQDWHPEGHKSFANSHGKKVGDIIDMNGLSQFLWPVHCVQESKGAKFSVSLIKGKNEIIVKKGTEMELDSYSGFFDNGHRASTDLDRLLKNRGIKTLFVAGLATDYCVKFTVLDALELGYQVFVVKDAIRGVGVQKNDIQNAIDAMQNAGATIITSNEV